ncbi:hypothetical protein GCM10009304_32200 [Pseudomonas matsuisoli]|uniref:Uncharacterized protein n=1 Tax=Pseudomonas matsuisoli TaxID=1515666 RepID=A0A917UZN2_9PSED|nr:hypothetical protein GCM10009304_32200 [Pseudomonas matsuisoli]
MAISAGINSRYGRPSSGKAWRANAPANTTAIAMVYRIHAGKPSKGSKARPIRIRIERT